MGDLSGEDGAADVEGAAGHAGGVELGDGDAAVCGVGVLDGGAGGGVEGSGVVEDVAGVVGVGGASAEGREAGVEVVETGVSEMQRGDGDLPCVGDVAMRRRGRYGRRVLQRARFRRG